MKNHTASHIFISLPLTYLLAIYIWGKTNLAHRPRGFGLQPFQRARAPSVWPCISPVLSLKISLPQRRGGVSRTILMKSFGSPMRMEALSSWRATQPSHCWESFNLAIKNKPQLLNTGWSLGLALQLPKGHKCKLTSATEFVRNKKGHC